MSMTITSHSHARYNPLTGEWLLISPQRLQRPWQGQIETAEANNLPKYDPECYLCPGNSRANANANPDYRGPFAFDNDFPALTPGSEIAGPGHPLMQARPESGCCRVICYSERHDLRLATMSDTDVRAALAAMIAEFSELDRRDDIGWVQVFENRGSMMGCSNAHPHAQVWATRNLPTEAKKELDAQAAYFHENASPLLADYLQAELDSGSRVIIEEESFVAVVPFWAAWPYEVLILPRRLVAGPDELDEGEVASLAATLKAVLAAYDRLFATSTPYSLGLHARPSDGIDHPEWQFHVHIYPPLLRSAYVRKHMVGFEMLAMPQRDLTPESAAANLRAALE